MCKTCLLYLFGSGPFPRVSIYTPRATIALTKLCPFCAGGQKKFLQAKAITVAMHDFRDGLLSDMNVPLGKVARHRRRKKVPRNTNRRLF